MLFSWFIQPYIPDHELQAKLHALVDKAIADQYLSWRDADRYEDILAEIYKRGLKPEVLLKPKTINQ